MSQRHLKMKDMPFPDQPLEEQFRIFGKMWAEHEGAWSFLKENKRTTLERIKTRIMDNESMPENKAERLARCTDEWSEYMDLMEASSQLRLDYAVEMKHVEMVERKINRQNANARSEKWIGR